MILLQIASSRSMFGKLIALDHDVFKKINQQWTNPFFDAVLPFLREAEIWLPFYLFLLVFITLNFGKKGWLWAFCLVMTGVIGDLFSSHIVKLFLFRYRPCRDPDFMDQVRVLVNYCPSSSSFTSSHACNHFAASVFIFLTLRKTSGWWSLVFLWAASICYAQVYVGVHFPLDILGGALLGSLIGYMMSVFFDTQFGQISLKQLK